MKRYLLAGVLLACGHTAPTQDGPSYVCYPQDASAPRVTVDSGPTCEQMAPEGCVLGDISQSTGPGPTWCCVSFVDGVLRCCQ